MDAAPVAVVRFASVPIRDGRPCPLAAEGRCLN